MTNRTALLIEDQQAQANLVTTMLEIAGGWDLTHVTSLADAEIAYATRPTDVAVVDLGLPDAEGPDLLQPLTRVLSWTPRPAVLVLTSHGEREMGHAAVDRGAQDFLEKGAITPMVLPRVLDYAVRRHQAVVRAGNRESIATARADALAAYAGAVSHDLRAPIASLISMATMATALAQDSPDVAAAIAAQTEHLEGGEAPKDGMATLLHVLSRVEALGRRALAFTDTLLHDAEQGSANRSLLDFGSLIEEAWQLTSADGSVTLSIGELPIGIYGLEAATRQALVNLLGNALSHVPSAGGHVHVGSATGEGNVRIIVQDNGPGVPTSARSTIFNDGVSGRGSTGRGLATVARQMERQGGRAWVEHSEQLGGAAFVLEYPARGASRGATPDAS